MRKLTLAEIAKLSIPARMAGYVDGLLAGRFGYNDVRRNEGLNVWAALERQPGFNEELERGKAELNAGKRVEFRAEGGPILPDASYLVGESGRETFLAPIPGTVIPNAYLGKMVDATLRVRIARYNNRPLLLRLIDRLLLRRSWYMDQHGRIHSYRR